jgi:hypothetical protein
MTHCIDCPPAATKRLPAIPRGQWPRIALYLFVILSGFIIAWNADTIRSALHHDAVTIPGEDWHGNVRRSGPGY